MHLAAAPPSNRSDELILCGKLARWWQLATGMTDLHDEFASPLFDLMYLTRVTTLTSSDPRQIFTTLGEEGDTVLHRRRRQKNQ